MRIAIDCRLIGSTGIGVFLANVLDNMVRDTRHSYLLIGNSQKLSAYASLSHCRILSCDLGTFCPKELLFFPTRDVNACDAFYTPNFNLPLGIKVPVFSTIHDILFFETENFSSGIHMMALKWYVKRALKVSRTVFTVSEFSKERIRNYFHTSTDIQVVPNGISSNLREYKTKHRYDGDKKGIVFLGSIKKHKGLHVLLDAYNKLQGEGGECPPLTVIGHVDFRTKDNDILEVIKRNKDKVNFLGAVDNKTLYDVLSRSAVLVSPSFYEGFGIPPLEAMYLGTPAIISDIPVYKEVYKDLPVTFFRTGDVEDLFLKLRNFVSKPLDISEKIDKMYNYASTAKNILSAIEQSVNV